MIKAYLLQNPQSIKDVDSYKKAIVFFSQTKHIYEKGDN
jgi:hypothetical protein